MAIIANRMSKIEPSPTLAITALANQLKADGKDVVGFGAGEPDFDTPQHIKDGAVKALADGFTKYSPAAGYVSLREAIATKLERDNKLSYKPDEIIVGTGGKQVIYNLAMALLDPGDEVLIPTPYWVSYKDISILAEATPKFIETGVDSGFKITPEQLDAAITSKTKMLLFNSPSNPTGATYTPDEIAAIAKVLTKHEQVFIASDDIYEMLIYDGLKFANMAMSESSLLERTIVINGLSKAYSMTGWRLGYAACKNKDIIKAMGKLQGQSTSGPNSFAQKGAEIALLSSQDCVEEMKVEFVKRRDYIAEALNQCKGVSVSKPNGAFYVFPDMKELTNAPGFQKIAEANADEKSPSKVFAKELLEKELVALVPGIAFGYEYGFRMSYATSMEQIKKGMNRIQKFVAACWA